MTSKLHADPAQNSQNFVHSCRHDGHHGSQNLRAYYLIRDELTVMDDLVIRGTHRLIVPQVMRKKMIELSHESHQGIVRTKQRLREMVLHWWPKMDLQTEAYIKHCSICSQHDKTSVTHTAPLTPVPLPDAAFEKVSVDIVGPFDVAPRDCRYAITLIDYYSKWPEVAFCAKADTNAVITMLTSIFSQEGNPCELVSDNGSQFVSHQFSEFLLKRGIRHIKSSVYYPRSNGEVERFNRV